MSQYVVTLHVDTDSLMMEEHNEESVRILIEEALEYGLDAGTRVDNVRKRRPND
jgi:hypothetical protein